MLPSLLLLATAAVAAPTHAQIASADWKELGIKKHADAGRVDIYRSKIEGFDCYAASATADVDAEVMLAILSDPSQATEWTSTDLSEAVVLSRGSAGTEYYQHLTLPGWMFVADRFWFAVGNIVRTDDEISWNYQKLEDPNAHGEARAAHRQRHPKAIELEMSVGSWVFRPNEGGTRVTFRLCADVGGAIPMALQKWATRRALPDTVGDVVREGRRRVGR